MAPSRKKPTLPTWNLSDLVPPPAEKNIADGLARAGRTAEIFRKNYAGKVARLSPAAFGRAILDYETLRQQVSRLCDYAHLDRQTKLNDPVAGRLAQDAGEKASDIDTQLLFFRLDIAKMPEATLKAKLKDKTVRRYLPWIEAVRDLRPHQLADDVEKALHERGVVGHPAWARLYDETSAALRFPVAGKNLTEGEAFHLLSSPVRAKRKAAAEQIGKIFGTKASTYALILNTIAKEGEVDDRQRGFKTPVSSRNLFNQVEDEVVDALVSSVRAAYPRLSHRYYKLKARWLDVKRLETWDRLAPPPFAPGRTISWVEAKEGVLDAYTGFHPDMGKIAARFFDNNWIDAAPRAGKTSGAFSSPCTPDVHPYILMNYKNTFDDVMTLAHELGHGIHQQLAAEQGLLLSDTSLPLAETASVFGEMLAFRRFLSLEKDPKARKGLIARKVEDMLGTVVRQIAFHDFETAFHTARRRGEVEPEKIQEIWMKTARDSLGPVFRFDEGYRHYWAHIAHFFHVPFYVYAYAFGDCLVNALYAQYQGRPDGFADKYLDLLKAGGTKRHAALLKPFHLNARDPKFWNTGLSVIEGLMDELEG